MPIAERCRYRGLPIDLENTLTLIFLAGWKLAGKLGETVGGYNMDREIIL
jgi:hypothetical protein